MRKGPNRKIWISAAVAVVLILSIGVKSAMAYFTTYAIAEGGVEMKLGFTTTVPEESVSDWTKHIKITNTGEAECFVRVKVFAGGEYQDALTYTDADGKWTPGADGYYYYSDVVPAGKTTEELSVGIRSVKEQMESTESERDFNVIVVQECTSVQYDSAGKTYADWTKITDSNTESFSGNKAEEGKS